MHQRIHTPVSKAFSGALTGIFVLVIVSFWAVVAVLFWMALTPYRLAVVELWGLVPADSRTEIAVALSIAGAVPLTAFIVACVVDKSDPAPYESTPRERRGGLDIDLDDSADIDVSGL